jgi:hypothetical protein
MISEKYQFQFYRIFGEITSVDLKIAKTLNIIQLISIKLQGHIYQNESMTIGGKCKITQTNNLRTQNQSLLVDR